MSRIQFHLHQRVVQLALSSSGRSKNGLYHVAAGTVVRAGILFHYVQLDESEFLASGEPVAVRESNMLPDTPRARELLQAEADAHNVRLHAAAQIELYRRELVPPDMRDDFAFIGG